MPLGAAKFAYQGYSVVAGAPAQASIYYDGDGDYLQISDATAFDWTSTDPWTVELWQYRLGTGTHTIFEMRNTATGTGDDGFYAQYTGTGTLSGLKFGHGTATITSIANGETYGQGETGVWHHFAFTHDGSGGYDIWVDGVSRASTTGATYSSNVEYIEFGWAVGRATSADLYGYHDLIRVSDICRYTDTFSPANLFASDANTILLITGDTGSIVDESSNSFTVTANGDTALNETYYIDNTVRTSVQVTAYGDAQVDTAQSKFGGASALFDGTGDGLLANHTMDFSSGAWTMECWIYPSNANTTEIIFDPRLDSQITAVPSWRNGGIAYFNGSWNVSTTRVSAGSWYHFAWVYDGSDVKCYIDGTLELTVSEARTFVDSRCAIGARFDVGAVYYVGHLDEIRFSNTARYTSNFTAPTSAFTNDADTILLIHCDGTDGSTTFTDDNS